MATINFHRTSLSTIQHGTLCAQQWTPHGSVGTTRHRENKILSTKAQKVIRPGDEHLNSRQILHAQKIEDFRSRFSFAAHWFSLPPRFARAVHEWPAKSREGQ
jgi:hypothetical protein